MVSVRNVVIVRDGLQYGVAVSWLRVQSRAFCWQAPHLVPLRVGVGESVSGAVAGLCSGLG